MKSKLKVQSKIIVKWKKIIDNKNMKNIVNTVFVYGKLNSFITFKNQKSNFRTILKEV